MPLVSRRLAAGASPDGGKGNPMRAMRPTALPGPPGRPAASAPSPCMWATSELPSEVRTEERSWHAWLQYWSGVPVVWTTRGDRINSGSGVRPTSRGPLLSSACCPHRPANAKSSFTPPFVYALLPLCPESLTFPGLQASRELPVDDTIECVLERALLHAGFIAPANYGDLFKVWARRA